MQPSELVVERAGGASTAMLNLFDSGGRCFVATQQIDEVVYVVGQDSFAVARYDLEGWLGEIDQPEPPMIECRDADAAWEALEDARRDCLPWSCAACDAWIFTSSQVPVGPVRCAVCGESERTARAPSGLGAGEARR